MQKTPPRLLVIDADQERLFDFALKEIWQYRDLLYFLTWRDLKVRYKQTLIGVAWAVLQPFLAMLIFTVIFGTFANLPSDGLPYSIFAYTALLPWTYFAQAIERSGTSLVSNANLITKVYFPRVIIPFSSVAAPLVDFCIAFVVLLGMMIWFSISPTWNCVFIPFFLLLSTITALAVTLWLSALNVRYRDIRYVIPFLIQIWMYASPVVYSLELVPKRWRLLYSLNPMVGVIEGFRWSLLGKAQPDFVAMGFSSGIVLLLLISGFIFFKRIEDTFADVI